MLKIIGEETFSLFFFCFFISNVIIDFIEPLMLVRETCSIESRDRLWIKAIFPLRSDCVRCWSIICLLLARKHWNIDDAVYQHEFGEKCETSWKGNSYFIGISCLIKKHLCINITKKEIKENAYAYTWTRKSKITSRKHFYMCKSFCHFKNMCDEKRDNYYYFLYNTVSTYFLQVLKTFTQ